MGDLSSTGCTAPDLPARWFSTPIDESETKHRGPPETPIARIKDELY
jgi:hypothetical protein